MRKLLRGGRGEKGSIVVEASISLTAFLFMFLMIYSIISICRAQARIQIALNNTAQEISQYSYIYGLTGLDKSLAKFQSSANETKDQVNGLVSKTINVFEGIQTLGDDAKAVDISNVDSMMSAWGTISEDLKKTGTDADKLKGQIETMAKDPQKLLFGMARLIGSETLEIGKSRLIAEPVTRALIQRNLKRSENDTAEAFCKSVGLVPGTYLGETSCFNGIDFSNSTLFPYGSEEITLIASYEVKIMQLLPIDITFSITQSARTKGWLHGDATDHSAAAAVETEPAGPSETPKTVWNNSGINERNKAIRSLELEKLKEEGYTGVSGETYIQAYDSRTNTAALIAMCNPVYGPESIDKLDEVDKQAVRDQITRVAAEIESATTSRSKITVKVADSKGNITTKNVDCAGKEIQQRVVLIVPEDPGVKEYVEQIVQEEGYAGIITVKADYGTGVKQTQSAAGGEK